MIKAAGPKYPKSDQQRINDILVMIFEKASTRTRVSFDVAMRQLGGQTIVLNRDDMQLGRGETIADTARVLSRYGQIVMLRTLDHSQIEEFARHASVPVVNGLTDRSHPCQIMADILTFEEHKFPIEQATIAWIGDANNVSVSWIHAAVRFGFKLRLGSPAEFGPSKELLDWVAHENGDVKWIEDPLSAAEGADSVITDVFVSMGDTDEERRNLILSDYVVDDKLMKRAAADAIFMHCLPANRGREVTAEVIDGPRSVVFDEAENRLHAQKAILAWCLEMI